MYVLREKDMKDQNNSHRLANGAKKNKKLVCIRKIKSKPWMSLKIDVKTVYDKSPKIPRWST